MADPAEAWSDQFDAALRSTSDALVTTAEAWHTLIRAYFAFCETNRRTLGGLLIDWHQTVVRGTRS